MEGTWEEPVAKNWLQKVRSIRPADCTPLFKENLDSLAWYETADHVIYRCGSSLSESRSTRGKLVFKKV